MGDHNVCPSCGGESLSTALSGCKTPNWSHVAHEIYPAPLGYMATHDDAIRILGAAKPRDVVLQFPLGGGTTYANSMTTILDYRPVQGPLTKEQAS
jgi:hypothetical protein